MSTYTCDEHGDFIDTTGVPSCPVCAGRRQRAGCAYLPADERLVDHALRARPKAGPFEPEED